MKKAHLLLIIFGITVPAACLTRIEPDVSTAYFNSGHPDTLVSQALLKLYQHYSTSSRRKKYYEIISNERANYIVNFCPADELLTVSTDPGSGWSGQYTNVDEAQLLRLADLRFKHLYDLHQYVYKDSILGTNNPSVPVKTNGFSIFYPKQK